MSHFSLALDLETSVIWQIVFPLCCCCWAGGWWRDVRSSPTSRAN